MLRLKHDLQVALKFSQLPVLLLFLCYQFAILFCNQPELILKYTGLPLVLVEVDFDVLLHLDVLLLGLLRLAEDLSQVFLHALQFSFTYGILGLDQL